MWSQPKGYNYYRIFITNEKDEVMKVTITYGKGSYPYNMKANSGITITAENEPPVEHNVSFSTSSEAVSSVINVIVSDELF